MKKNPGEPRGIDKTILRLFLLIVTVAGGTVCHAFTRGTPLRWQIGATIIGAILAPIIAYGVYKDVIERAPPRW